MGLSQDPCDHPSSLRPRLRAHLSTRVTLLTGSRTALEGAVAPRQRCRGHLDGDPRHHIALGGVLTKFSDRAQNGPSGACRRRACTPFPRFLHAPFVQFGLVGRGSGEVLYGPRAPMGTTWTPSLRW